MHSLFQNLLLPFALLILLSMAAADAWPAMAALLPPEAAAPEEKAEPSKPAPQRESSPQLQNPFQQSTEPHPYEAIRRKREKTTIYIILGVVLLLCGYWWTSGKLHHKIPKMPE